MMRKSQTRRLTSAHGKGQKMISSANPMPTNENMQPNAFFDATGGGRGDMFSNQHALKQDSTMEEGYGLISLSLK